MPRIGGNSSAPGAGVYKGWYGCLRGQSAAGGDLKTRRPFDAVGTYRVHGGIMGTLYCMRLWCGGWGAVSEIWSMVDVLRV